VFQFCSIRCRCHGTVRYIDLDDFDGTEYCGTPLLQDGVVVPLSASNDYPPAMNGIVSSSPSISMLVSCHIDFVDGHRVATQNWVCPSGQKSIHRSDASEWTCFVSALVESFPHPLSERNNCRAYLRQYIYLTVDCRKVVPMSY